MTRRSVLSTPASHDLDDIVSFVLENSGTERAERVLEGFYTAFEKLASNPGLGHRREDLTASHVLFYRVWSWFVIFRFDEKSLDVARVVHASRDIETLLQDESL